MVKTGRCFCILCLNVDQAHTRQCGAVGASEQDCPHEEGRRVRDLFVPLRSCLVGVRAAVARFHDVQQVRYLPGRRPPVVFRLDDESAGQRLLRAHDDEHHRREGVHDAGRARRNASPYARSADLAGNVPHLGAGELIRYPQQRRSPGSSS